MKCPCDSTAASIVAKILREILLGRTTRIFDNRARLAPNQSHIGKLHIFILFSIFLIVAYPLVYLPRYRHEDS
jgi:hypothetical protein